MRIDKKTVQQLMQVLSQDQWSSFKELMAVPHWDKETVKMALKMGTILGAIRSQAPIDPEEGELYIATKY